MDKTRVTVPDDGLIFPTETVTAEKIKEEEQYEGVRVRLLARMVNVRIPLQVDIGFGDALTKRPGVLDYPTLLPMPAPQIRAYRWNPSSQKNWRPGYISACSTAA